MNTNRLPAEQAETSRLYGLLREARFLRQTLERLPYQGRISDLYHRALRRERRRNWAFTQYTEALHDKYNPEPAQWPGKAEAVHVEAQ